jgi:hypothetical protein
MKPLLYVVGDSISMHYGPYFERFIAPRFRYARKSGIEGDLNRPDGSDVANGGDSSMVLNYLRALRQTDFRADVFLLNCGLHDIKYKDGAHQVSLDDYCANLREIVLIWRALSPKPVWVRTTPVDDAQHFEHCGIFARYSADVMRYNTCADAVMRENKIAIIDLHSFSLTLENPWCDHVHYTEAARAQQAAFLAGALWNLDL